MLTAPHAEWARERVARILAAGSRQRVVAVLAMSEDRAAAVDGRSTGLSSAVDRAFIGAWRAVADVLLVGSRTLAAERYGQSLIPAESRDARVARGQRAVPQLATIDRSGTLSIDAAMRAQRPLPTIVYRTGPPTEPDPRVEWADLPAVSIAAVVEDLRGRFDAPLILVEAGPVFLAACLEAGTLTDLSVTIAPVVVGGDGPRYPALDQVPNAIVIDEETVGRETYLHYLIGSPGATPRPA